MATQKQPPQQSIMNRFDQQTYLGNQYAEAFPAVSLTTTETAIYLLSLPTGASQRLSANYEVGQPPVSLFLNILKLTCLTANAILRVYYNPTITSNGTAASNVINLRPSQALTGIQTLVYSGPTVSANGTLVDVLAATQYVSAQSGNLLIVDPGAGVNSILITGQASAAATASGLIGWHEI